MPFASHEKLVTYSQASLIQTLRVTLKVFVIKQVKFRENVRARVKENCP